jgi:hypothetical protein
MNHAHTDPVAKLLTYGEVGTFTRREPWPDYGEFGFTEEHIADLIRMATDPDLHLSPQDSAEVRAPVHAWRALARLRAVGSAREPGNPLSIARFRPGCAGDR